ncbi:MAG TPA: TPM domain-containing protein [Pyrinomonadaceae bacterium]|nr:TPM domain-containing protein [Pyrinomonadaceae bacterium]
MQKSKAAANSGIFLILLLVLSAAITAFSQTPSPGPWSQNVSPLPAPTGFVNDYAGVIDAATKSQLEARLKAFKESSSPSTEMAVAVVRTTGDRDIFDYSLAVARGWKIGSKDVDNPGALLVVAVDDRKYFTQISKDLEDELPDGVAGSLQRQYLVPEFRKGNYGKGIADTIDAYIRTIEARRSGAPTPTPGAGTESGSSGLGQTAFSTFCCLVIIGIIILVIIANRFGGKSGGGRRGGGGSGLPWIIPVGTGGSWGSSDSSSSSSSWGSGGGGSDWGGFGGGGDFGGGGAGGDW